jgi:hypothetical protein
MNKNLFLEYKAFFLYYSVLIFEFQLGYAHLFMFHVEPDYPHLFMFHAGLQLYLPMIPRAPVK